jgi:hypothetical protein
LSREVIFLEGNALTEAAVNISTITGQKALPKSSV